MHKIIRLVYLDHDSKTVTISDKEQVVGAVQHNDGVLCILESEPFTTKEETGKRAS